MLRIVTELKGKKFNFDITGNRGRTPNEQEQEMLREYVFKMESLDAVLAKAEQYDLLVEAHELELEAKDAQLHRLSEYSSDLNDRIDNLNLTIEHYKDTVEDLQSKYDELVSSRNAGAWLWFGVSLILGIALIASNYAE
jgi:chromosome segregation ATPase